MGSKNSIAHKIIHNLPKAENFYDLFCGGGAISHCAILSEKYKHIHMNDLDGQMPQLFVDAVNGKYLGNNEWITREEFNRRKSSDALVRVAWSFGNRGDTYCYGKDVEDFKKAYWYALFYDDFTLYWKLGVNIPIIRGNNINDKRLKIKKWLKKHYTDRPNLYTIQSYTNLRRINNLSTLVIPKNMNLSTSSGSYDELEIKKDSVIYCDIPYEDTGEYVSGAFDHKKFYDWANNQDELLVISSYDVSDERFVRVVNFKKTSLFTTASREVKNEGLFIPKGQLEKWRKISV